MLKLRECCDFFWDHPYDWHGSEQDLHCSTISFKARDQLGTASCNMQHWTCKYSRYLHFQHTNVDNQHLYAEGRTEIDSTLILVDEGITGAAK